MVLDTSLLNTQHYKEVSRVKWRNPGEGIAPFPTPQGCSYWKESIRVAFNYSRQHYYLYKQNLALNNQQ